MRGTTQSVEPSCICLSDLLIRAGEPALAAKEKMSDSRFRASHPPQKPISRLKTRELTKFFLSWRLRQIARPIVQFAYERSARFFGDNNRR